MKRTISVVVVTIFAVAGCGASTDTDQKGAALSQDDTSDADDSAQDDSTEGDDAADGKKSKAKASNKDEATEPDAKANADDDDDAAEDDTEKAEDDDAVPDLPPPPDPVSCGDVDCKAPPFGVPCCTTEADVEKRAALNSGACGVDLSAFVQGEPACVEFDQPGELDDACPNLEVKGAPPAAGCCTTHGVCGTLDTFIGLGCVAQPPELGQDIACGE